MNSISDIDLSLLLKSATEVNTAPVFDGVKASIAGILGSCLEGKPLGVEAAALLFNVQEGVQSGTNDQADIVAILKTADWLRSQQVGQQVTYVVNRNINFTNVCVKRCGFCAFSRGHKGKEGYFLPITEIVRRAEQAAQFGATEVCIQAGLAPHLPPWFYVEMVEAVKTALPHIHIHACSPEEVLYGAELAGVSIKDYLQALKQAGLGSLPGTSAEILVSEVRDAIAPGRIDVESWKNVIQTAHQLDIPSSATMMYGHIETAMHKALHLDVIRTLQQQNGKFTEFVPLGFIYEEAPIFQKHSPLGLRSGPTLLETLLVYAVSRLMLHPFIPNIQVSWVKEGAEVAQLGLLSGANDLGGTLINESISTSAGSKHGQLLTPSQMHALVREIGRIPAERTTAYQTLQTFDSASTDPEHPLDSASNQEQAFGSYQSLIARPDFRFKTFMAKA